MPWRTYIPSGLLTVLFIQGPIRNQEIGVTTKTIYKGVNSVHKIYKKSVESPGASNSWKSYHL